MVRYYSYSPLQEGFIRLLKIQPRPLDMGQNTGITEGPDIQEIEMSLIHVEHTHAPAYDALSYTWGDPTPEPDHLTHVFTKVARCYPILCGGHLLLTTRNLRDALAQLREFQLPQCKELLQRCFGGQFLSDYIWIDALCINQDNPLERGRQVAMMGSIYKSAALVVAWLGPSDKYLANADQVITTLSTAPLDRFANVYSPKSFCNRECYGACGIPYINASEWTDFAIFMNRNWFKRVWVMQEVALAKDVLCLCGRRVVDLDLIIQTVAYIIKARWQEPLYRTVQHAIYTERSISECHREAVYITRWENLYHLKCTRHILDKHTMPSLVDNLYFNFSTKATDPRDHVYSLLAMSSEFEPNPILPNYTKSVSEIFIEVTKLLVEYRGDAEILCLRQDCTEIKVEDLPSWCPDYATLRHRPVRKSYPFTPWSASGSELWTSFRPSITDSCLHLDGRKIDIVLEARPAAVLALQGSIIEMCEILSSNIELALSTEVENDMKSQNMLTADVIHMAYQIMADDVDHVQSLENKQSSISKPQQTTCVEKFVHALIRQGYKEKEEPYENDVKSFVDHVAASLVVGFLRSQISERSLVLEHHLGPLAHQFLKLAISDPMCLENFQSLRNLPSVLEFLKTAEVTSDGSRSTNQAILQVMSEADAFNTPIFGWYVLGGSQNRAIIRTGKHFIGNAPKSVMAKDEVWLLSGATVPFILRPLKNGHYTFIGDVYTQGLMYGEALAWAGGVQRVVIE